MNAFSFEKIRKRWPCGKYKPVKDVRKELEGVEESVRLAETVQVANQPHRNGNRSDMAHNNLGAFILSEFKESKEEYRRKVYDSAYSYYFLTKAWRTKVGVPPPLRETYWHFETLPDYPQIDEDDIKSSSDTILLTQEEIDERVRKWRKRLDEWNGAMDRAGKVSSAAAKDLILDDKKPHPQNVPWVRRCLQYLAKAQGWD